MTFRICRRSPGEDGYKHCNRSITSDPHMEGGCAGVRHEVGVSQSLWLVYHIYHVERSCISNSHKTGLRSIAYTPHKADHLQAFHRWGLSHVHDRNAWSSETDLFCPLSRFMSKWRSGSLAKPDLCITVIGSLFFWIRCRPSELGQFKSTM